MSVDIAVLGPQRPHVLEALERDYSVHNVIAEQDQAAALAPVAQKIRAVVTNAMVGMPAAIVEALPNLEICVVMGVGLERIDLVAAKQHDVTVTTTPVLYDDVSDLAVILAMTACRRIAAADRFVRSGKWLQGRMPPATKFSRKRAGILGFGRIGVALAKRLEGFGMEIGYFDPMPKPDVPYRSFGTALELASSSDIVFLSAAGGPAGGHIVTAEIIEAIGPNGIFVNVARGWLVDEPALVEALVSGRLGAAGLDVFDDEPTVPDALLTLDNVVLTPHIASSTQETMQDMGDCVLDNVRSWFAGKGAVTPVG